jgi:hypothetical protein
VTATRDRRRDLDAELDGAAWDERPALGVARGWPWWGAVLLALGLSFIGAVVDMQLEKQLSIVFEGAYFIGCVGAVVLVRRRNLFGPMVQAPLVLVVVIPVTVVVTTGLPTGGMSAKAIAVGDPLLKGFPVMAITTGAAVLIGVIRYLTQRRPVDAEDDLGLDVPPEKERRRRPADRDAERPERELAGARRPRPGEPRDAREPRRSSQGRPAAGRDRAAPRERGAAEGRGRASGAAERSGRADSAGRGERQERGGAARGSARPPREENRRQPPRRRDDDC